MCIKGLTDQIEAFKVKMPHKIAIKCGELSLTYTEVLGYANGVANFINRQSIEEKNIVVLMDRSIEMVTTLLGVLKAGKVIVPIDPSYPSNRITYMLKAVNAPIIFTTKKYKALAEEFAKEKQLLVVSVDLLENEGLKLIADGVLQKVEEVPCSIYSEKAYIYFTSGSTGKPKGILGKQSSLMHYLNWEIKEFNIDDTYCSSQLISPSFDPYLRDVFIPLLVGGTLVIPPEYEIIITPKRLLNWLKEEKINLMHMGKTLFNKLFTEVKCAADLDAMKCIFLSGESLKGIDIKKEKELAGERIQLVNLYGPTETTLAASYHVTCKADAEAVNVPIGKGIDDVELFILDEAMQPCEEGEIYIATAYATAGYYANQALTLEKFKPYGDKVLYQTGDIGRKLENGEIICLGRKDRQIKINGLRIELGEVETVLANAFKKQTFVVVPYNQVEDQQYLVAYYTGEVIEDTKEITDKISLELPRYMIPARYTYLEQFPLLPNGKIDVKSLINLEAEKGQVFECFKDALEAEIARMIDECIHIKVRSTEENLLYLGANSLDATTICNEIYSCYQVVLTLPMILKEMTVAHIASCVKANKGRAKQIVHLDDQVSGVMAPVQKGMFILNQFKSEDTSYNVTQAIVLKDLADKGSKAIVSLVQEAYEKVVLNHEILRTVFYMNQDGKFIQEVKVEGIVDLQVLESADAVQHSKKEWLSIEEDEDLLEKFIAQIKAPFKLDTLPLFKVFLVKCSKNEYLLLQDSHHIILDEISGELLFEEVLTYIGHKDATLQKYADTKHSYIDYSYWQNKQIQDGELEDAKHYWQAQFKAGNEPLELPIDFKRKAQKKGSGKSVIVTLDKTFTNKLREKLKTVNKTASTFLLTAFAILIGRYSGQQQFTIGIPTMGRNHPAFRKMLGMFVNTLPFNVTLDENIALNEMMENVFENMVALLDYQDYPFNQIVEDLGIKPELSRNPLYDVIFNFITTAPQKEIEGLISKKVILPQNTSKFDLALNVYESQEHMKLCFEYDTELFKASTIKQFARHYKHLLEEMLENNGEQISKLNYLGIEEIAVLEDHHEIAANSKTIIDYFLEQVQSQPLNPAITIQDEVVTYKDLDVLSNQIATKLLEVNKKGNQIVGVLVKRNKWLIASILGVLRAGLTYLPIDTEYPEERITYMLENSQCQLVIADEGVEQLVQCETLNLKVLKALQEENLPSINLCHNETLAYLIYTSGSTGKPKGVMISNGNLSSFCESVTKEIPFEVGKRILCVTTVCFDIFVLETLVPLAKGGQIILADEVTQRSPYELSKLIIKHHIEILQFTPSRLKLFIDIVEDLKSLESVERLIVGGEAFDESILNHIMPTEKLHIYNIYGPTEATVWCAVKEIKEDRIVTLGKPFENTRMYILDTSNRLQPTGVIGELYIGGACVSRGYMNRPDLTEERFIPNPYIEGEMIYKTGDKARRLENGEYEFLGRTDFQVKLRGFRIELTEIEKCILDYEGITACVCHLHKAEHEAFIVAYYIANKSIEIADLREVLGKALPYYMIPEVFMAIEQIPFTLNGKVDRKALPKPERQAMVRTSSFQDATSETEKRLQGIWQELLGIDQIGIEDNFFDIGGNSALLVKMHYKIVSTWHNQINVSDLFSYPTIAKLSQYIEGQNTPQQILKTMNLPEAFFERTSGQSYGCSYALESASKVALESICIANDVSLRAILLALYVYTVSVVTDSEKVNVYKQIAKEVMHYEALTLDLEDYEDFIEIANSVCKENETYIKTDFEIKKSQGLAATIGYYFEDSSIEDEDFAFDIKLVVKASDAIQFNFYYDPRINGSKIEELLSIYINIVEAFIEKENIHNGEE